MRKINNMETATGTEIKRLMEVKRQCQERIIADTKLFRAYVMEKLMAIEEENCIILNKLI